MDLVLGLARSVGHAAQHHRDEPAVERCQWRRAQPEPAGGMVPKSFSDRQVGDHGDAERLESIRTADARALEDSWAPVDAAREDDQVRVDLADMALAAVADADGSRA